MFCGYCGNIAVYFVCPGLCAALSDLRYRVTWIGYPDRYAGAKPSLYVESYESVKVHEKNTRAFVIDSIIRSHMNII